MRGDCQKGVASRHGFPQRGDLLVECQEALRVGFLISPNSCRRLRWARQLIGNASIDVGLDQTTGPAGGMSPKVTEYKGLGNRSERRKYGDFSTAAGGEGLSGMDDAANGGRSRHHETYGRSARRSATLRCLCTTEFGTPAISLRETRICFCARGWAGRCTKPLRNRNVRSPLMSRRPAARRRRRTPARRHGGARRSPRTGE